MSFTLWGDGKPHAGQQQVWAAREQILDGSLRTVFLPCGPRWGKDRLSVWLCLYVGFMLASQRQDRTDLVPTVHQWVVSARYKLLRELWDEYIHATRGIPGRRVLRSEMEIHLPGPYKIGFRSTKETENLLGVGLDVLHVTEAAEVSNEAWFEYLEQRLLSPGRLGFACINGTPTSDPNDWYVQLWHRQDDPSVLMVNEPSWSNPHLTDDQRAKIEAHRSGQTGMPERDFRTTFGAELIPQSGAILRHVGRASTGSPEPGGPGYYVSFFDPAPTRDFNAVATFLGSRQVYADRWQDVDWPISLGRLARLREYPGTLYYDIGAGQWTGRYKTVHSRELSRMAGSALHVEGVSFTAANKEAMTTNMIFMLEQGQVELLDPLKCEGDMRTAVEAQVRELGAWKGHKMPSGSTRYAAPDGQNDDMAVSVMMAALKAKEDSGRVTTEDEVMRMLGGGLNI